MFFAIIGAGTPAAWTVLNVFLLAWRGQTGGQYMAGSRVQRADGSRLSRRRAVAWWCCFNPLLWSWPMACIAALPLALVSRLVLGNAAIVVFGVLVTACIAAPLIALVSALVSAQHRSVHDRLVGAIVVSAS
jgi:hypothetical protein